MRIPTLVPVAVLLLTGTCAPAPGGVSGSRAADRLGDAGAPAAPAATPDGRGSDPGAPAPGARSSHPASLGDGAGVGDGHPGSRGGGHRHHEAAAPGRPTERSIYHLPGTWTDQDGRTTTLAGLAGRVQVMAMVYTHCTFACPRILARMKALEGRLAPEALDGVGFVLVSIDPERDTPERLRSFAGDTRLDTERWTLLNGGDADVLALSVLLGVKVRATGDGEYAHSNILTVLDPDGEIVARSEGLNADVQPVLEAVRRALRGRGTLKDR